MKLLQVFINIIAICFAKKELVKELNDNNFLKLVTQHKMMVFVLYVPWKINETNEILPTLEIVAEALEGNNTNVLVGKMNCFTDGANTCDILSVRKYPMIQMIESGSPGYFYEGPVDAPGMAMFFRTYKKEPGSFELKSGTDLDAFMMIEKKVTIISFIREDNDLRKKFFKTALKMKKRFAHISYDDEDFKDGLLGHIVLFQPEHLHNTYEDQLYIFEGTTIKQLKKFINDHYYGLVPLREYENSKDFKYPLVIVYYNKDIWRPIMLPVAAKFRNKIKFAISPIHDFTEEFKQYGEDVPDEYLVVARDSLDQKYIMNETLTTESLTTFVDDVLNKRLKNFILSQPIPDWNNGYVKIAVRDSFDEIVTKNKKDVFILFFAPWCEHCIKLEPIFEELGKCLVYEDIDIVHMDMTGNDVPLPFNVTRFPDIFWYSQRTKVPISYEGPREIHDFIKYITANASKNLKKYYRNGKLKPKKPKVPPKPSKDEL